jgi:hypothetical protein
MTQYILDTDHVTALQHKNPRVLQRIDLIDKSQISGQWEVYGWQRR